MATINFTNYADYVDTATTTVGASHTYNLLKGEDYFDGGNRP